MEPLTSVFEYNGLRIQLTTNEHTLTDVLEAIENVLRGQGYQFDGHIDVLEDYSND